MDYAPPTVDVIESATQLIQFFVGPSVDGNGLPNSLGGCNSLLEVEPEEDR